MSSGARQPAKGLDLRRSEQIPMDRAGGVTVAHLYWGRLDEPRCDLSAQETEERASREWPGLAGTRAPPAWPTEDFLVVRMYPVHSTRPPSRFAPPICTILD